MIRIMKKKFTKNVNVIIIKINVQFKILVRVVKLNNLLSFIQKTSYD